MLPNTKQRPLGMRRHTKAEKDTESPTHMNWGARVTIGEKG